MSSIGVAVFAAALLAVSPARSGESRSPGLLTLAGQHVKWGSLGYGTPATVAYAYLDAPRDFPGHAIAPR